MCIRDSSGGGYSRFRPLLGQLTLRTCRKTFSHYGHLSSPQLGSEFIATVLFPGFEIGSKIAANMEDMCTGPASKVTPVSTFGDRVRIAHPRRFAYSRSSPTAN